MKGTARRRRLRASWMALAALLPAGCTTSFELRARPADAAIEHDAADVDVDDVVEVVDVDDVMVADVTVVDVTAADVTVADVVDVMVADVTVVDVVDAMVADVADVSVVDVRDADVTVADVADVRDARVTDTGCSAACPSASDRTLHITASACVAGACTVTCEASWGDCNRRASDGCEVSLATVSNCGTCGLECVAVGSSTGCCLRPMGYRCCRTRIGVGNVCSFTTPSTTCD